MTDDSQHILSAEQPSFSELREQFRQENQDRIRRQLREHSVRTTNKLGEEVVLHTGFMTDAPPGQDHRSIPEFEAAGGQLPMDDDFVAPDSLGLQKELKDLARDAKQLAETERVKHPSIEEAPALESLDDEYVDAYMQQQVKGEE